MFTKDAPIFDPQDIEQSKTIAAISYFYILFFLPLITHPKSAFARYNANQALVLFIFTSVVSIVSMVFTWIPIIGGLFSMVVGLFNLLIFIVVVMCIVQTFQGIAVRVPIIGHITLIK